MKINRLLFYFAVMAVPLAGISAQVKVQWASELIGFSSELKPSSFGAKEVLGSPSVQPERGQTTCAWATLKPDGELDDFIEVGFAEPQQVSQILVNEPMNPGAIFEIYLYDTNGKKYKVLQQVPKPIMPKDKNGRLFRYNIAQTPYQVKKLRLVLMSQNVPGYNLIDAIGISSDTGAYEVKIETIKDADLVSSPENLGPGVNSSGAELAPLISSDGRMLYFTRVKHPKNVGNPETQDIWYAYIDSTNNFGTAYNVGEPVNNARNNALCAVLPDGQTLMLMNKYLPDGSSENGISISLRTESGWSFPSPIEVEDFYNEHRTGEYALGSDGKTILMAVQRQDAIGEKDIYVSFKKEDGSWAAPMNLGPEINTGDSEIAPFLAADGRTVYFSTGGYPGYGGQDMFVSRRLDDSWKKWSKPLNLGPKLNTSGFDAYYSLPASGNYAYFTSTQSKVGNSDIFRVKLPESAKPEPVVLIRGRVLNAKTNDPLGATIAYESLTSGKQLGTARSHPTTGEYSIVLPSRDVYGFLAEHKGFLSLNENIDLVKINEYKEMRVDLKLTPLEVGAAVRLNNIFFDTNKYNLKPQDELELKRVVKMLQAYPNMQIEISGHTDNVGADQSNLTLSSNRAKAVTDYLVAKGVAKNRLQSIGLGKTKPVSDNKTEEGRAYNRRIEMKVLKVE